MRKKKAELKKKSEAHASTREATAYETTGEQPQGEPAHAGTVTELRTTRTPHTLDRHAPRLSHAAESRPDRTPHAIASTSENPRRIDAPASAPLAPPERYQPNKASIQTPFHPPVPPSCMLNSPKA